MDMNDNSVQRNSAPTGAQDSESNSNADRPLGGAACSASFSYDGETYASSMPYQEGMTDAEKENILRFQLAEAKRLMREEAIKNRNHDVV